MNNRSPWMRRLILYGVLMAVTFLLGFAPMWLRYRECAAGLAVAQRQLSLTRTQNSLASAAIEAQRGDYESARESASVFFTSLRAQTDPGADSALSQAQVEAAQALLTQRDDLITLLARGDAAAADRLSDLYGAYSKIANR